MQTRSKKPRTRSAPTKDVSKSSQHERFKEMARELGADESPDALDRAFAKLNPKRKVLRSKGSK